MAMAVAKCTTYTFLEGKNLEFNNSCNIKNPTDENMI